MLINYLVQLLTYLFLSSSNEKLIKRHAIMVYHTNLLEYTLQQQKTL